MAIANTFSLFWPKVFPWTWTMYIPPLQRINFFNNLFRLFLTKSFVALLAAGTCNTANTSVADQLLLTLLTNTCSDLIAVASHVIITWNTCYAREKWTSSSRTTLWKGCGKQTNGKSVNNLENDFIPVADVVKYLQWTLDNRHITFTIPKAALLKS